MCHAGHDGRPVPRPRGPARRGALSKCLQGCVKVDGTFSQFDGVIPELAHEKGIVLSSGSGTAVAVRT